MNYVSARFAQADLRKLRGSTIERKQMSTKTIYKRIALVAVASLGAGLLSVAPASAAIDADELNLVTSGSTLVVSAASGADTAIARVGAQTIAYTEAASVINTDAYDIFVSTAAKFMGHSNPLVTLKIYTLVRDNEVIDVGNLMREKLLIKASC